MNTRDAYKIRATRGSNSYKKAPIGMAQVSSKTNIETEKLNSQDYNIGSKTPMDLNSVCESLPERSCRHPLTNMRQNAHLARCEESIKVRFDSITPVLKKLANLQHESDFVSKADSITSNELGFNFPIELLETAWVDGLNMKALYAKAVFNALNSSIAQFSDDLGRNVDLKVDANSFFLDCGYHSVDITPCSDGRLKGLAKYILRLPLSAITVRNSYAGALFNVESNVRDWEKIELDRLRNGKVLDDGNAYLKIVVYHRSGSDPSHQGCAAHGSNDKVSAEAGLEKLTEFREAIENTYCCGSAIDILLIGVDTDNDSIRVHVPDSAGNISVHRYVDTSELYNETLSMSIDQARVKLYNAIDICSDITGWGQGAGRPAEGMRKVVANLLEYNLSQIEYVADLYGGMYPDIGHAERYISVGNGFQEIQLRNIAYFAHLDTVEEGSADLDIGIKIFTGLNLNKGLPAPIAIHYRYDSNVPGSRKRMIEKCYRVKNAIINRYKQLAENNNLYFQISIQDLPLGSSLEIISEEA
ncbi:MAG: carboxysome shell carbonic anhydrase [Candidatus Thioglobus sp.]